MSLKESASRETRSRSVIGLILMATLTAMTLWAPSATASQKSPTTDRLLGTRVHTGNIKAVETVTVPSKPMKAGVEGLVQIDGGCPVVIIGKDCAPKPFQAAISFEESNGKVIAKTSSDINGHFSASLHPGTYTVRASNLHPGVMPYAAPQTVAVRSGSVTQLTIMFDSGIR